MKKTKKNENEKSKNLKNKGKTKEKNILIKKSKEKNDSKLNKKNEKNASQSDQIVNTKIEQEESNKKNPFKTLKESVTKKIKLNKKNEIIASPSDQIEIADSTSIEKSNKKNPFKTLKESVTSKIKSNKKNEIAASTSDQIVNADSTSKEESNKKNPFKTLKQSVTKKIKLNKKNEIIASPSDQIEIADSTSIEKSNKKNPFKNFKESVTSKIKSNKKNEITASQSNQNVNTDSTLVDGTNKKNLFNNIKESVTKKIKLKNINEITASQSDQIEIADSTSIEKSNKKIPFKTLKESVTSKIKSNKKNEIASSTSDQIVNADSTSKEESNKKNTLKTLKTSVTSILKLDKKNDVTDSSSVEILNAASTSDQNVDKKNELHTIDESIEYQSEDKLKTINVHSSASSIITEPDNTVFQKMKARYEFEFINIEDKKESSDPTELKKNVRRIVFYPKKKIFMIIDFVGKSLIKMDLHGQIIKSNIYSKINKSIKDLIYTRTKQDSPQAICYNNERNFYLFDSILKKLREFEYKNDKFTEINEIAVLDKIVTAFDICCDQITNNIYVSDSNNDLIAVIYNKKKHKIKYFNIEKPKHMCIYKTNLYVISDDLKSNPRIIEYEIKMKFKKEHDIKKIIELKNLTIVRGLHIDHFGNIYTTAYKKDIYENIDWDTASLYIYSSINGKLLNKIRLGISGIWDICVFEKNIYFILERQDPNYLIEFE